MGVVGGDIYILVNTMCAIYTGIIAIYTNIKEWFLKLVGVGINTRSRQLLEQGNKYLVTRLAQISATNGDGYAIVDVPFSYLPTSIIGYAKHVVVITDHSLAKQIGNYGVTTRLVLHITTPIIREKYAKN